MGNSHVHFVAWLKYVLSCEKIKGMRFVLVTIPAQEKEEDKEEKKYPCSTCGQSFRTKRDFMIHIHEHQTRAKKFQNRDKKECESQVDSAGKDQA